MPDRDKFRSLPAGWRPAARAFAAFARGKSASLDQMALAQGFLRELDGLPTLAPTLRLCRSLHRQPPLVMDVALDDLARVTTGSDYGRNDCLLREEAERCFLKGEFDGRQLVKQLLRRVLRHNVIESKGGVAQRLRSERLPNNSQNLIAAAEPTIEHAARQLLERPNFKRLSFGRSRPIDLDADLLGAQW